MKSHFICLIAITFVCLSCRSTKHDSKAQSLEELATIVKNSYENKQGDLLLNHYLLEGTPPDLLRAQREITASSWGTGGLVVKSVKTLPFDDYSPSTGVPGNFQGKQLQWLTKPSHWIILRCELPKQKDANLSASAVFEMAAVKKNGQWLLVGVKYAP